VDREAARFRAVCEAVFGVPLGDRPLGVTGFNYHEVLLRDGWDDLVAVQFGLGEAARTAPPAPAYHLTIWFGQGVLGEVPVERCVVPQSDPEAASKLKTWYDEKYATVIRPAIDHWHREGAVEEELAGAVRRANAEVGFDAVIRVQTHLSDAGVVSVTVSSPEEASKFPGSVAGDPLWLGDFDLTHDGGMQEALAEVYRHSRDEAARQKRQAEIRESLQAFIDQLDQDHLDRTDDDPKTWLTASVFFLPSAGVDVELRDGSRSIENQSFGVATEEDMRLMREWIGSVHQKLNPIEDSA
jgi:hypothetical protein